MTGTASAQAGFQAVDHDPEAATLVAALDVQATFPAVQRLRAAALDLLTLRHGDRVLDAGCGSGHTTEQLATRVGPDGKAVGIDVSDTMLAEARHRHADTSLPIEFRHGDLTNLDLETASFDAVYCERVFQHLDDPESALAELARVTRNGGRLAVIDTDWGMHAINGADPSLTRRAIARWAEHAANGWAGRRLLAQAAHAGLVDPIVIADTITIDEPPPGMQPFATMAGVAEHAGCVSADEAAIWLRQLGEATASGSFFWAVTMFLVATTRP